jgi:hypothetical protein
MPEQRVPQRAEEPGAVLAAAEAAVVLAAAVGAEAIIARIAAFAGAGVAMNRAKTAAAMGRS